MKKDPNWTFLLPFHSLLVLPVDQPQPKPENKEESIQTSLLGLRAVWKINLEKQIDDRQHNPHYSPLFPFLVQDRKMQNYIETNGELCFSSEKQ